MKIFLPRLFSLLLFFILNGCAYLMIIRPWHLQWGATEDEITRSMPGDEITTNPTFNATRAITIKARPEEIWPWIIQIGDQRAGFYGYDWFENRGIRSAEVILPEFQQLKVGDRIPISAANYQYVQSMTYPNFMVWVSSDNPPSGSWAWGLYPIDENHTRLITRMRGQYDWISSSIFLNLVVDVGDLPFMRKCILGIKQRAEGNITDTYTQDVTEGILWGAAFLEFTASVVFLFRKQRWWPAWMTAMGSAVTFLIIFYVRPSTFLGVLLEIIILACIIWLTSFDTYRE